MRFLGCRIYFNWTVTTVTKRRLIGVMIIRDKTPYFMQKHVFIPYWRIKHD